MNVCKKGLEFQCSEGEDENSSVLKIGQNSNVFSGKQITIPMFLRIGPKLQCLEEKDHNSNA